MLSVTRRRIGQIVLNGFLICVFGIPLRAQTTTISGVINVYTPVLSLSCNSVDVASSSGFAPGDRVLVIQMKGAIADSSNTSAFGSVLNYRESGNFEFAMIAGISGNTVFFQKTILNSYQPSALVQLVRVPVYANALVNATLTCLPWNGTTGGVLVLQVAGMLSLNANLDVSGKGFLGGKLCTNPDGGCGNGYADFYYQVSSGFGAEKGEGIVIASPILNGGRGAWGNGGGGGNKHNSGGGGGGNFSMGGPGGNEANFCPVTAVGGVGGDALTATTGKVFLGGGGGCSDNNNGVGTYGANGGGLIILDVNALSSNGDSILSNGLYPGYVFNNIGDGAGGGGAGGSILLKVNAYAGALVVETNGGRGGDQYATYPACFGPGGGGGVGLACFSLSSLPVSVSVITQPGHAGMDLNPASSCYNTSYGAGPGLGATGQKFGLVLPEGTFPPPSVELGNDTILCSKTFTLNAGNAASAYQWSTGATTNAIQVNASGLYWVRAGSGGCIASDSINVTIVQGYSQSDTLVCADSLLLTSPNPSLPVLWSTGQTTPSIGVHASGTYTVQTTAGTCSRTDVLRVELLGGAGPVSVPNVFTPNGDGKNDLFEINELSGLEYRLQIFDRWGTRVFEQTAGPVAWNGLYMGNPLSEGVYYWILEYTRLCPSKGTEIKKGFLSLLH